MNALTSPDRKWLIMRSGKAVYSAIMLSTNGFYVDSHSMTSGSVSSRKSDSVLPSGE